MAYPKPLSRKTLEKKYSGLDPETRVFLHRLFTAAANLYGVVCLDDVYRAYMRFMEVRKEQGRESAEYVENIEWDKFVEFSSVARRDGEVPYCIYETTELFSVDQDSAEERFLVNKILIGKGYYGLSFAFLVMEEQGEKDFYVPNEFLNFEKNIPSPAEKKLIKFLGNLKSTAPKVPVLFMPDKGDDAHFVWNTNRGKYLKNIRNILPVDARVLQEFSDKEKMFNLISKRIFTDDGEYKTFAEQVLEYVTFMLKSCMVRATDSISLAEMRLSQMGVELTNRQFKELTDLLMNFNNNLRMWGNRGATPRELHYFNMQEEPKTLPNLDFEDMINSGNLNIEKLRQLVFDDEKIPLPAKKRLLDKLNDLEKKM